MGGHSFEQAAFDRFALRQTNARAIIPALLLSGTPDQSRIWPAALYYRASRQGPGYFMMAWLASEAQRIPRSAGLIFHLPEDELTARGRQSPIASRGNENSQFLAVEQAALEEASSALGKRTSSGSKPKASSRRRIFNQLVYRGLPSIRNILYEEGGIAKNLRRFK